MKSPVRYYPHIMYKYSLFLLILLCASTVVRAMGTPDYRTAYHPSINQAELSIVANDFEAALAHYEQAFDAVPRAFARDLYNAAVCASLTNNEKLAFNYFNKMVDKGVSLPYLQQQEVFQVWQGTKPWKKFEKKYPRERKKFTNKAELDERADLDELYARDQYFRNAKGGLRVHGDTIRKIEAANVKELLRFIGKRGYPSEELIGVADTVEQMPRFNIVIQRQRLANNGFDFSEILTRAVKEGRVSPHVAAYLIEQQLGNNQYKSKAFSKVSCNTKDCEGDKKLNVLDRFLVEKLTNSDRAAIDALRTEFGLDRLAEYKIKILYGQDDKRFKLGYDWSVINYNVPSKEAALVLTERMVAIME